MRRASVNGQGVRIRSRRGGKRPGAGRKPKGPRAGVSHDRRETFSASTPIHVTVCVAKGVPNLRSRKAMRVLTASIRIARERLGVRITQYSIQRNHIHMIVEAEDRFSLSRGMKGFAVRIARRLNLAYGRKGRVFDDRYHAHILRTPLEIRNAVRYVMNNSRIHAERRGERWDHAIDPYAGGPCPARFFEACRALIAEPRALLLRRVWNLPWRYRPGEGPPPSTNTSYRRADPLPSMIRETLRRPRRRHRSGARATRTFRYRICTNACGARHRACVLADLTRRLGTFQPTESAARPPRPSLSRPFCELASSLAPPFTSCHSPGSQRLATGLPSIPNVRGINLRLPRDLIPQTSAVWVDA